MIRGRIHHQKQNINCGNGSIGINLYTGEFIFSYPLLTIGSSNFEIPTSLIYHSNYKQTDFNGRKIGFGNGWKLNIEQHVFLYENSFNLEGFSIEDYVYIDAYWNIHQFVYYKTNVNGIKEYYDAHNTEFKLLVEKNGEYQILDSQENKLIFNHQGRLTKFVSGIDLQITKIITYQNQNIHSIYDQRKPYRKIEFEYQNDLLINEKSSEHKIGYDFEYHNCTLSTIKKHADISKKDIMYFKYDVSNQLEYVINSADLACLKCTYLNESIELIEIGAARRNIVTNLMTPEVYIGEGNYVNEDKYVISNYPTFVEFTYDMPQNYVLSKFQYTYHTSNTIATNEKNIATIFNFDIDGTIISQLELKDNFKIFSLSRLNGWELSTDGNVDLLFDGKKPTQLEHNDENREYIVDSSLLNEFKMVFNDVSEKYSEHFTISFWMKFVGDHQTSQVAKIEYTINQKVYTSEVFIYDTPIDSWQNVMIPIDLGQTQNELTSIKLLFTEASPLTDIQIVDMRILRGRSTEIKFYDVSNYYETLEPNGFITYCYNKIETKTKISKSFYLTANDITRTFKNLHYAKVKKLDDFDLVYCNGKKLQPTSSVSITFNDGYKIDFSIDDNGLANYFLQSIDLLYDQYWAVNEVQSGFYYDTLKDKCYYMTKQSYGLVSEEFKNKLNDDDAISKYDWVYQDGTFMKSENIHGIINENIYDNFGNLEKNLVYHKDKKDEIIETIYEYDSISFYREIPNLIIENEISKRIIYDEKTLTITSFLREHEKFEFVYDEYIENIQKIIFTDLSLPTVVYENNIHYNQRELVDKMMGSDHFTYGFQYNIFEELTGIYKNSHLVSESKSIRNKYTYIQNIYQDKKKPIESIYKENQYEKPITIQCDDKVINYFYEKSSLSTALKRISKIEDPYTGQEIEYFYSDYGTITSTLIRFSNEFYVIEYSDHSIEYKIKEEDPLKFAINKENPLSSNIGTSQYENAAHQTIEEYEEFYFTYRYDQLNRFSEKSGIPIYLDENKSKSYIDIVKGNDYKKNTNLPVMLTYTISSYIKDEEFDATCIIYLAEYDVKGNMVETTEYGDIYNTIPKTKNERNKTTLEKKKYQYTYDSFNRLIKEVHPSLGTIEYQIDQTSQMIHKIIKNGNIEKEFLYENGILTKYIHDDSFDISYDNFGNIVKIGENIFSYNSRNLLESYENRNGKITYEYDYQGIRFKKIRSDGYTIQYYYYNQTILGEDWIDSHHQVIHRLRYFYDAEGITGIRYNNRNYHLFKDLLGNINKIEYHGKIIGGYEYDAYGNHIIDLCTTKDEDELFILNHNPFRYKGYYYDIETGLFYCNSRYYSPEFCRWITPDSIDYLDPESINGLNLYCYCANNPVMYVDPSGHDWEWSSF